MKRNQKKGGKDERRGKRRRNGKITEERLLRRKGW